MLFSTWRIVVGLPHAVRLLLVGTLINRAGMFILPFLTLVLRRELSLSPLATALLVAAYGVGSLTSILGGGWLADRLGRRSTLQLSLFASGVLALTMIAARTATGFVPLLLLYGFLADLYRPAATSMIGDLLPSRERAIGFAALRMAHNLGFFTGMALGGLLAALDWRLLFLGDGLTTLAFGLLVHLAVAESRPTDAGPARRTATAGTAPLGDRVFLLLVGGTLLFSLLFFLDVTVLPLTITTSAGYPPQVYGLVVGANGLLIALFEVWLVARLQRFRRLRVAAVGAGLAAVGVGLTGVILHWAWFLVAVVLWSIGEILTIPQQTAFLSDWAPVAARGRYFGVIQATWGFGLTFAPLLFLPLHSRLAEWQFWPATTLLGIPLVLVLLHLDRVADRPDLLRGASAEAEAPPLPAVPPAPQGADVS